MALSMDPLIPGLPDEVARECLFRVPYTGFRTAKSVSKLWRDEVESAVFHHFRKSTGLSRTVIAMAQSQPTIPTTVISSSDSTEENNKLSSPGYQLTLYEPETGTWSTLPPVPSLTHGLPLFCQVAAVGHKLVVLGGWDPTSWAASDKVFIFDFVAATWRRGENMPEPRRSFFACASDFDRTIFVAGGHDEKKNALRSAVAYVVEDDMWVPLPDMTEERDECKGVFSEAGFAVSMPVGEEAKSCFHAKARRPCLCSLPCFGFISAWTQHLYCTPHFSSFISLSLLLISLVSSLPPTHLLHSSPHLPRFSPSLSHSYPVLSGWQHTLFFSSLPPILSISFPLLPPHSISSLPSSPPPDSFSSSTFLSPCLCLCVSGDGAAWSCTWRSSLSDERWAVPKWWHRRRASPVCSSTGEVAASS